MKDNSSAGFSVIDVMIAIVILNVGILGLLATLSGGILMSRSQETQLVAKQAATSALESISSVKETDPNTLGWIAIGNVGSNPDINNVPRGIFVSGEQPVEADAGPDQVLGTADDTGATIPGLTRRIIITDVCDPDRPSSACTPAGPFPVKIRTIEVIVNYRSGLAPRQERIRTVLTDYAVTDQ